MGAIYGNRSSSGKPCLELPCAKGGKGRKQERRFAGAGETPALRCGSEVDRQQRLEVNPVSEVQGNAITLPVVVVHAEPDEDRVGLLTQHLLLQALQALDSRVAAGRTVNDLNRASSE